MASKASFSPEEWTKLLQSVMMAGIAVTAAEPSGLWGTLKESMVAGHALLEAKSDARSSELIKAVVADFETAEGRAAARERLQATLTGSKPGEVKAKAVAAVREAAALLDAKAPDDAATFKAWLRHISEMVADASTEGGFLGFGGVRVSEAEKATLAEIAGALGVKG
ncbi:MAG TPA: hypothetical protein VIA61_12130 [Methylomirabilota bacterium]|jgi:hypothetical protein